MKVELSFKEDRGVDRGGVDVMLHVRLVTYERPLVRHVASDTVVAFKYFLAGLKTDAEGGSETNESLWLEGEKLVSCTASYYDYNVERHLYKIEADLVQLAVDGLREGADGPEWVLSLRTGFYSLEADLYRHGNAD